MAEKGAIVIPITLVAEGGGGGSVSDGVESVGTGQPANDGDKSKKKAADNAKSSANAAKAIISKVAGQVMNTALNSYGDITGNYVQQQNLQTVVSEGGKIAGAVALGPVGIGLYAVDKAVQWYNFEAERKKSERDSAFAQKRVYGSTTKA